ncbi:MAG: hypothetical protein GX853_10345, partial [Chloroflexi bacterium]|nr:hypothetical protein [Chloroflexota bacterium]
ATHRLTFAPFEVNKPIIEWRMRMKSTFYIYVQCVTSLGTRHIRYHSGGTTRMLENNDPEIALGNGAVNSGWVTIRRHLLADLRMFHPGAEIYEVRTFMVRCVDSWVDDIRMLAYPDSDMDLIPDDVEIANGLNPYSAADAELDLDGDGLTNLEEFIIGTDMNNIDTDGDGLTDFDEKHIFGTNPLLADTDGDGVPDDVELENNMDPLTPALAGNGYMYEERIIEDAEDGLVDGWNLWAGALPAQAINAPDPVDPGNRAIFLSGTADACHRLTFSSVESEKLILEWRMRTGSSFYIYVQCATSLGTRHIRYHSGGTTRMLENDDPEIAIQIGPAVNGWYTVRRHLLADLRIFHPDAEIYNVRTFMIRSANGYVDDIRMLAYPDSDMDLIPDDVEIANDLDPYSAADAALDYDNDGLTNLEEFFAGTDMYNADTDGDGISDYAELNTFGTNALSADTDGDGLTDLEEIYDFGTDPLLADTDGDGVPDGVEIDNGMNPFIPALSGNGFMYEERIIEDAEDGLVDGWNLWAGVLPAQ